MTWVLWIQICLSPVQCGPPVEVTKPFETEAACHEAIAQRIPMIAVYLRSKGIESAAIGHDCKPSESES